MPSAESVKEPRNSQRAQGVGECIFILFV